ncbi:hypothetical protein O181_008016 [Austropuccinia psidii MF-1]|uniref:Trehalase n=1 Tax=Austropuccinia psidii MF-1 TaxID=1389203 RepID=A0A9Q3BLV8_9BASI|nr:hypothetical protein [Austropuccinia psidii MF-1]
MRLISFDPESLAFSSDLVLQQKQKTVHQLLQHISIKWSSLVRSNLAILDLLHDPKLPLTNRNPSFKLYVRTLPNSEDTPRTIKQRLQHENPVGELENVQVIELPSSGQIHNLNDHGTLYLPYPYVVPGGRFQEMYAWDSFFIMMGLLRDNHVRLVRNMLDNYIYQIEHYGTITNGNRTYYLTRSQLPFLTPLIKLILPTVSSNYRQAWLKQAIRAAEAYHAYWTTGSHLVPSTGLSRFFDSGPPGSSPPEIIHESDPRDGSSAHDRVKRFFRQHYHHGIPDYNIPDYYDYETDQLTPKFMDNDRAMRESGFDTSARFGPFNSQVLDFNPVCLNSLLALMEREIGELYGELDRSSSKQIKKINKMSKIWSQRADNRIKLIRKYNWDEDTGLYFDYDFVRQERRKYVFATTFLPLWTGIATQTEAERVVKTAVQALEIPGGISTSNVEVADQWDKPYVWAPLQLFAVDGLRKYGYNAIADRLAVKFNSMVLKTWLSTGELWEKYDGIQRNETVNLKFGYPSNEIGFGWTNAIFTRFFDQLKEAGKENEIIKMIATHDNHSLEDDWVEIKME